MNKEEELKRLINNLKSKLRTYSKDNLMREPKDEHKAEWREARELIRVLEQVVKYEKQNIEYLVRDDSFRVLGSFMKLNEAIIFAEKEKREYMRKYNNTGVWVEINGETERVYEAVGYEMRAPIIKEENVGEIEDTEEYE